MDYGLCTLMLRDHERGKTKYNTVYTLRNVILKIGTETEFEELKVKMRPYYKILNKAFDEKYNEIPGIVSDEMFGEIVGKTSILLDEYWRKKRKTND